MIFASLPWSREKSSWIYLNVCSILVKIVIVISVSIKDISNEHNRYIYIYKVPRLVFSQHEISFLRQENIYVHASYVWTLLILKKEVNMMGKNLGFAMNGQLINQVHDCEFNEWNVYNSVGKYVKCTKAFPVLIPKCNQGSTIKIFNSQIRILSFILWI